MQFLRYTLYHLVSMDGNKDAAQTCLDIGNKALKDGDKAKALKFLSKAQRLDPQLPLGSLLSSLRKEMKDAGSHGRHTQHDVKQNVSATARANGNSVQDVASAEQFEIVQRIRKTKDYYQILGLNKDCTAEEIRKAYKKISLRVHPDKNSAPGAEEAFKQVSKAFACLSEEDSRAKYDQYGPEDPHQLLHQNAARHRHSQNGYAYGEMFDADEIFNSFLFGTNYNAFQRTQHVRRYRTAGSGQAERSIETEQSGGLVTFLQLLPVVALLLLSLIPLSKPIYSMEQVSTYQFRHSTKDHQVPFYVSSVKFDKEYPPGSPSRKNVEAKVERDMIEMLGYNCRRELHHRRWNPSLKTPNCDRLQSFYSG